MNEKKRIIHHFFYPDQDNEQYYMVILFMEGKKVVNSFTIEMPSWFTFSDTKFQHYALCYN